MKKISKFQLEHLKYIAETHQLKPGIKQGTWDALDRAGYVGVFGGEYFVTASGRDYIKSAVQDEWLKNEPTPKWLNETEN